MNEQNYVGGYFLHKLNSFIEVFKNLGRSKNNFVQSIKMIM